MYWYVMVLPTKPVPPKAWGHRKYLRESGDPNLCMDIRPRKIVKPSTFITTKQMAVQTQVDERWLKQALQDGTIPSIQESHKGRYGFRYLIDIDLASRVKILYHMGRKRAVLSRRGFTRDGINYHHDGTTSMAR